MKTAIKRGQVYRDESAPVLRRLVVKKPGREKTICLVLVGPNAKMKNSTTLVTVANSTLVSKRFSPTGTAN